MEIKLIAQPQEPLRRMDPCEVLADRNPVYVFLEKSVTLQIENATVTYPAGQVAAPAVIANILVEAGGEIIGSNFPPRAAAAKPERVKGQPTPSRGGLAGSMRTAITYPKFGPTF